MRAAFAAALRLARLPLAGTALADVLAGHACAAAGAGLPIDWRALLLSGAAAVLFYGAGMSLNDAFDARRDRSLPPERPLPAGAISRRAAFAIGAVELVVATGVAALASPAHAAVGLLLAAAILLYDGLAKHLAVALPGALAMGLCRYLDVRLGAASFAGVLAAPAFPPAVLAGGYVALLTLVSSLEEEGAPNGGARPHQNPLPGGEGGRRLLAYVALVPAFLLGIGLWLLPHPVHALPALASAGTIAALAGARAYREASRDARKRLTLALLLGIFLVDAASLFGYGRPFLGGATLALAATFPVVARLAARLTAGRAEG